MGFSRVGHAKTMNPASMHIHRKWINRLSDYHGIWFSEVFICSGDNPTSDLITVSFKRALGNSVFIILIINTSQIHHKCTKAHCLGVYAFQLNLIARWMTHAHTHTHNVVYLIPWLILWYIAYMIILISIFNINLRSWQILSVLFDLFLVCFIPYRLRHRYTSFVELIGGLFIGV